MLVPSAYYPHAGGIEETTRRLALELLSRGHDATVVTNRWPAGTPRGELIGGVRVRRLSFELPARTPRAALRFAGRAPVAAAGLLRAAAAFRPHVVHVHGAGPNAAYVAALRRLLRGPVVFSAHGEFRNDAHAVFEHSRPLRRALGSMLAHAAAVVAPSQVVLDELVAAFGGLDAAEVIPNAVDLSEFGRPRPAADPAGPYVLAAGRLVAQKGFDVLLEGYARARPALRGHRLVIAGDGPERATLERLADRLGAAPHVAFAGSVGRPRIAELMRGAAAFAFPSRREAFGIALLEAMAAGTPAVAARVGGIPEFARDGENALLVPPDDADRLGAALVRLVTDPALRKRLSDGGRAQAELHSWSRVAPLYEDLYRRVG